MFWRSRMGVFILDSLGIRRVTHINLTLHVLGRSCTMASTSDPAWFVTPGTPLIFLPRTFLFQTKRIKQYTEIEFNITQKKNLKESFIQLKLCTFLEKLLLGRIPFSLSVFYQTHFERTLTIYNEGTALRSLDEESFATIWNFWKLFANAKMRNSVTFNFVQYLFW